MVYDGSVRIRSCLLGARLNCWQPCLLIWRITIKIIFQYCKSILLCILYYWLFNGAFWLDFNEQNYVYMLKYTWCQYRHKVWNVSQFLQATHELTGRSSQLAISSVSSGLLHAGVPDVRAKCSHYGIVHGQWQHANIGRTAKLTKTTLHRPLNGSSTTSKPPFLNVKANKRIITSHQREVLHRQYDIHVIVKYIISMWWSNLSRPYGGAGKHSTPCQLCPFIRGLRV